MAALRTFRIPETVIHQTLDGEAVVINLDNGRYYALNECGSLVWNALADGHSDDIITSSLAPTSADERSAITHFLDQLVEQELIRESADRPAPASQPPSPGQPLTEPRMEVFTDMERLLPLDPLHEVDERGWPNRKLGPS